MKLIRFCASRSFHESLYLFATPEERLWFAELLRFSVEQGDASFAFPEEGQLLSGAAFYIEYSVSDVDDIEQVKCRQEAMLDPKYGEWRVLA